MFPLVLLLVQQVPVSPDPEKPIAVEETVVVTATRTDRRVDDEPVRVEVVPPEEVQEKIMMAPGDISMLLNETNGLRVQTTSPSLGGANVRIQGLRGRYTQILADGLPLYGGQTGAIGILQISPMDLGQVEVVKGVASALYGASAVGGVVNLVSRRPTAEAAIRELLLNRTSHGGTDAIVFLAQPAGVRWGYTLLGGGHWQARSDLDDEGWTDLPMYRRAVARPRLYWENGRGASLLLAGGVLQEDRRGGTLPGRAAPDGGSYREELATFRADVGAVVRTVLPGGRLLALRGSATRAGHRHVFGPDIEDDAHRTFFGEASITASAGGRTWVAGAAWQIDEFQSRSVPRFDYRYSVPGLFGQHDLALGDTTLSAGVRIDFHSDFGTFVSPRLSALVRAGGPWSVRLSAGRGYFAPTPFTEETEATGLSLLEPLSALEAERADSISGDVTWARRPVEITGTLFYSRIRGALDVESTGLADFPIRVANAKGPTVTRGTELIARYSADKLDVIATHMYLWSTEPDPAGGAGWRREVPLNPRHAASLDILWEIGFARTGIELFYTGRQALEDNPYRVRGEPYLLWGALVDWGLTDRLRLFVNAENLGDVRQTRREPLTRRMRGPDGRWTVDAWAPLEGRTVNAGLRARF